MDILGLVSGGLGGVQSWASAFSGFLKTLLTTLFDTVKQLLKALAGALKRIAAGVLDALRAMLRGDWKRFWHDLVNAWKVLQQWAKKIHDTIYTPIDNMRRTIAKLYDTFWKPVISVIDSMRRITQVIGVFDRKLAARLDQRLWALEGKILSPITALTQRLNRISSYFSSVVTRLGLLDRPLLLQSLKRDCSLIWTVLLNPLGRKTKPVIHTSTRTPVQVQNNYRQYLKTGTGYFAVPLAHAQETYRQTLTDLH